MYRLVCKEIKKSTDVCPLLLGMFPKRPVALNHLFMVCSPSSAELQLLTGPMLLQPISGDF